MRVAKRVLFALALLPMAWLVWGIVNDSLGANPVEKITHTTGDWALRFLLITLSITPLKKLTGRPRLLQLRRMLGLYAFFYACVHFLTWLWLDHGLYLDEMLEDVLKRPYVTLGFSAFLLLIPLAVTSTNRMMRRLGRRWKTLHKLVYPAAMLAVIHFMWLVKADYLEPVLYGLVLLVLLVLRLPRERRARWLWISSRGS